MRFFKSSKPEEVKEEAPQPRPVAPEPRPVNATPASGYPEPRPVPPAAPPVQTPAPQAAAPSGSSVLPASSVGPLDGLAQGPVAPLGAAPKPVAPAVEPRPVPPPAPKTIPDADALRDLVQQAVRDSEGSKLEAVRLGGGASSPSMMVGGSLNFPALYEKVGVSEPPFSAEQVLEMLAKYPSEMPLEMKRATVKVNLDMLGKKINTTEESIVGDTNRKMTTLASFAREYDKKTKERVAQGEAEIADLLAQVEAKRQAVAAANERYATIQKICAGETQRLSEILEFFKANPPALVGEVFATEKGKSVKEAPAKDAEAKKPAAAPARETKPAAESQITTAPANPASSATADATPSPAESSAPKSVTSVMPTAETGSEAREPVGVSG